MFARVTALLMVTMVVLTFAHCAEVGVWALFYDYADVTAKTGVKRFRIRVRELLRARLWRCGAAAGQAALRDRLTALNGLLLIGWSVAIIFEVMRMAEVQVTRKHRHDAPQASRTPES